MFLIQEPVPEALEFRLDLQADHQAPSAVLLEGGIALQLFLEPGAEFFRPGDQTLLFNDFKDGDGGGASDVVAAESRATSAFPTR